MGERERKNGFRISLRCPTLYIDCLLVCRVAVSASVYIQFIVRYCDTWSVQPFFPFRKWCRTENVTLCLVSWTLDTGKRLTMSSIHPNAYKMRFFRIHWADTSNRARTPAYVKDHSNDEWHLVCEVLTNLEFSFGHRAKLAATGAIGECGRDKKKMKTSKELHNCISKCISDAHINWSYPERVWPDSADYIWKCRTLSSHECMQNASPFCAKYPNSRTAPSQLNRIRCKCVAKHEMLLAERKTTSCNAL